jgi:peptide/nickel transport system substrate-binding protein
LGAFCYLQGMSRAPRRAWRIRPLGGLLLALLAFAFPTESRAQTPPRQQITIGITQFPSTFNPMIDAMVAKSYILGMARRPMMTYDKDWKLVCMMCTEIPTFENGRAKLETTPDGKKGIALRVTLDPAAPCPGYRTWPPWHRSWD